MVRYDTLEEIQREEPRLWEAIQESIRRLGEVDRYVPGGIPGGITRGITMIRLMGDGSLILHYVTNIVQSVETYRELTAHWQNGVLSNIRWSGPLYD